jgi:hypothetical protein
MRAFLLVIAMGSFASTAGLAQPLSVDQRVEGQWRKVPSGDQISFDTKTGDVVVNFVGQLAKEGHSGPGHFEKCTKGGGNLCISTPALGECSFTYSFSADGVMNLATPGGGPTCNAMGGDYTRVVK